MSDKKAVLVVEDNDFVRMQIKQFLESGDHPTFEAANVSDGIDIVKNHKNIGCILVDVRMEPEDGFDFLNQINAMDIKIPSILVTGDNNYDILAKGSSLGVVSVLMKPIDRDRLLKMVGRAIS
jgi:DNA-binding NtrC family response regulator